MVPRQYALLGPLQSGAETRGFLGCEMIEGAPRPDRPIVLAWLPDEVTGEPRRLTKLLRETAFVTRLKHPGILSVHGIERFEEGWARITDFADGEPLALLTEASRARGDPFPCTVAARIILDLAEAVHHAHEEGAASLSGRPIVHGGIRPGTVLVGYDGRVLLSGYGAAVFAPMTAHSFDRRSWAAYLAPEQIIGGKLTTSVATDVYALGALLYTLLSGDRPFSDVEDVDDAIMSHPPPLLEAEGVRADLAEIARSAMAKRGALRPVTAAAFADSVRAAIDLAGLEPAGREIVADLMNLLLPPSLPVVAGRADLLETATDMAAVTPLTPVEVLEEGIEPELRDAARPSSLPSQPAPKEIDIDISELDGRTRNEPPNPSGATIAAAEAQLNQRTAMSSVEGPAEDKPSERAAVSGHEVPTEAKPSKRAVMDGTEEVPTQAPAVMGGPEAPISAKASEQGAIAPTSSSPTPASRELRAMAATSRGRGRTKSFAEQRNPQSASSGDEFSSQSYAEPDPVSGIVDYPGARPVPAQEPPPPPTSERMDATASPGSWMTNQPVHGLPIASPVARMGDPNSEITQFNPKAGDGSRSLIFLVTLTAFGLLLLVLVARNEVPEGLSEKPTNTVLDRDSVRKILADQEPQASVEEPVEPPPKTTAEPDTAVANPEVEAKVGRVHIRVEPAVDVYHGRTRLGRTPLQVNLPVGRATLRLTDKTSGINTYRTVRVRPDRAVRINETFDTSELIVNAPMGARIYLNGRFVAEAPMTEPTTIFEGRYLLLVNYEGMRWTERFKAAPGRRISVDVEMDGR